MLEAYTTEEQRSIVRFLWAKGLNAKDIHKEMFPVYGGKCLSRKVANVSLTTNVESQARKWLRQHPKNFYAAGFDALVKRWDKCISVGREHVEK
jgi:hypothetical protein